MPDRHRTSDRSAAERQADHAGLARLSDTLVPALVQKLNGSGLGELEVREGDWSIRLRRSAGAVPHVRRDRTRHPAQAARPASTAPVEPADPNRAIATSPAVGVFRTVAAIGSRVRAGDRLAVVDLLGIPQDVPAPIDGVLLEFIVETGAAVEYGEEIAIVAEPVVDRPTGGSDDGPTAGEGRP